jgi:hypothetical protein
MSEMQADDRKCQAMTKSGKPCGARPLQGQTLCALHADPARARDLAKRPRKNGVNMKPEANPPEIPPLQTATEIRAFLAQVMTDLRKRVIDSKTASVLASLATAQLRAVAAAELEERVTNLEKKVGDTTAAHQELRSLPSEEEWQRMFAPDDYTVPPPSPAPHESENTQPTRRRRTMPEGWTVPDRSPEYDPEDDTRPLNREIEDAF